MSYRAPSRRAMCASILTALSFLRISPRQNFRIYEMPSLKSGEMPFARTGAANFSVSSLKRQDNDPIVIKDTQAAAKFKHAFEGRFASGEAIALDGSN